MSTRPREQSVFTVSLTQQAHRLAEQLCQHQTNLHKAEQIYFNTLAVYAVSTYLRCLGWEIDWQRSDSQDEIAQTFLDVADLEVKELGKLECRPMLPGAEFVYIPEEVHAERIGYVAVQIDEALQSATLLGFVKKVATDRVPLHQLRSLAELPGYLKQISSAINLNQWFDQILVAGWQTVESLLATESVGNLAPSFKDIAQGEGEIIKGVKQINLNEHSIVLLLALMLEEEQISIRIQVHPVSEDSCLAANLKLALLTEAGKTLREVTSRSIDNFIQLPRFQCRSGESFRIQLTFGDISMTESFFL